MESLNFWNGSGLFYWPNLLYSPGAKKFGANWQDQIAQERQSKPAMMERDRYTSFCMVDSGGFQIVTDNRFTFLPYNDIKRLNEHRLGLLRWQEATGDMALTFEAPSLTAVLHGAKHPRLRTDQDCLDFTLESMKFAEQHQEADVKWIAPIQGVTFEKQKEWYSAVKAFKPYGYAFPCSVANGQPAPFRNAYALLRMLRHMIEDGAFDCSRHIHLLGIVGPITAVFASALKGALPITNAKPQGFADDHTYWQVGKIEVTFDAASYSIAMARGNMYVDSIPDSLVVQKRQLLHVPQDEVDAKTGKLITNVSDVWAKNHDQIPGDMQSPILNGLRFSDLVGWCEEPYEKTGLNNRIWDPVAWSIMIAQNVWAEIQLIKDAMSRLQVAHDHAAYMSSVNDYDDPRYWELDDRQALGQMLINMGEELKETGEHDVVDAEAAVVQFLGTYGIKPPGILPAEPEVTLKDAVRIQRIVSKMLLGDARQDTSIPADDKAFLQGLF